MVWGELEGGEGGGGGGAVFRGGGGLGAEEGGGGGGGAAGGPGVAFLGPTGGGTGGALPPGGGGGARGGGASGPGFAELTEIVEDGRWAGLGGGFLRLAMRGLTGGWGESVAGGAGGGRELGSFGATGGFGALVAGGGLGFLGPSDFERNAASELAPVSTPPRFFSFGIPPAKRPASCGGDSVAPLSLGPPVSLPLLTLPAFPPPGTGGAMPDGGFAMPGTGGAPPTGPLDAPELFEICGADLSFVTVFLSCVPFVISVRRAPFQRRS